MSVAAPILSADLLESLAQNGKPPGENGNHVNGDGPRMRHRGHGEEPHVSAQGATESSKSYTAEQLEAVRKLVHTSLCICCYGLRCIKMSYFRLTIAMKNMERRETTFPNYMMC